MKKKTSKEDRSYDRGCERATKRERAAYNKANEAEIYFVDTYQKVHDRVAILNQDMENGYGDWVSYKKVLCRAIPQLEKLRFDLDEAQRRLLRNLDLAANAHAHGRETKADRFRRKAEYYEAVCRELSDKIEEIEAERKRASEQARKNDPLVTSDMLIKAGRALRRAEKQLNRREAKKECRWQKRDSLFWWRADRKKCEAGIKAEVAEETVDEFGIPVVTKTVTAG